MKHTRSIRRPIHVFAPRYTATSHAYVNVKLVEGLPDFHSYPSKFRSLTTVRNTRLIDSQRSEHVASLSGWHFDSEVDSYEVDAGAERAKVEKFATVLGGTIFSCSNGV